MHVWYSQGMENVLSADECRAKAADYTASRHESQERCDTDGFISQWADGLHSAMYQQQAQIAENGGLWGFNALTRLSDGAIVDAKMIDGKYGLCWMIRNSSGKAEFCPVADVPQTDWNPVTREETPSEPVDEFGFSLKSQKRIAKKGYRQVKDLRPAKAVLRGSGRGLSGNVWVQVVELWERD